MELTREPSWMDPIIAYLKNDELSEKKTKAHILQLKAARYVLYDDKLYRRGYSMPLLKRVLPIEVKNIMCDVSRVLKSEIKSKGLTKCNWKL